MAKWDEVDFEIGSWTVPEERAKQKRPHVVPLSNRTLEILAEAQQLRNESGLIFPSPTGKMLSDMTLSKLVKALGFDADIHGFRTSFRTWGQEQTSFQREVQEAALGHKIGDMAEQAYARSDMFEKRRKLMETWALFLAGETQVAAGNVLQLGKHNGG